MVHVFLKNVVAGVTSLAKMATTIAVKTKQKTKREPTAYNELAVRTNNGILDYCRTSMSSLSGAAAGVLGLTGLYGFAFYFIMAFALSFFLMMKAGTSWNKYFISRRDLVTKGLFGGLFTYVLCWTFLYGMVHVY
ncbi:ER membrane protein complex subunit 6-like [Mercenaria mercenaria]|uniref:ER membrane protein complex subunit 6-like n=1 Tax=Mercenaria mercenaria TaxID=6596 RepID=UPI00234F1DF2|nr:ER membrane protein complex subunit 6-like [Mercenaria mercenaria]